MGISRAESKGLERDENGGSPLAADIRKAIETGSREGWTKGGGKVPCLTFREYMALCLYHPRFGYYRSGQPRVGRDGDFYTSAYVGDVMGTQLAERLAALAKERFPGGDPVEVLEWGGGSGRLAGQMLAAWREMAGGERFRLTVVDGNPAHRRQAAEALAAFAAAGRARVMSPDEAERENWRDRKVIVTANELLDAFPVYRVVQAEGKLREWGVCWDPAGRRFAPCLTEPSDSGPEAWLKRRGVRLQEGQTTEVGLDAADWMKRLAASFGDALLVLIDYGDATAELTGPHRMAGTLLCYENHRAHDDPYARPGEMDITAHVDFDLIREAASEAGWQELWYGTQKRFLVETGVLAKLADHGIADPFHPVARRNRAIRQLLLSDGMSELFKVQIFGKGT